MGLIDKAFARFGYTKATQSKQYVSALAYGSGSDGMALYEPDPAMYANQAELMQRLSWVYAAVTMTCNTVASLADFEVYDVNGEEKQELDNHPFEKLLRNPNPYQFDSRFEFFEALVGYLRLNGNAYIYANSIGDNVPPSELWVLRPDRVTVIPSATQYVSGYVYDVNGKTITFEPWEIVHLKNFHPLNDWYGLSAIEALSLAAESDFKQQTYNRNFFSKDNAKPQGAIAFADNIADSAWEGIKSDIKRNYGETERRTMLLRGVGQGGVQWLQMGLSQKDMEFLAGRQFTKEEIYHVLAPGLIAMLDKNTTEANSTAGERTFREYCVWPMMQRVAEKLTAKLLPRYGENLVGEFADIRIRDRALQLQEIAAYSQTHTIAEIRREHYNDDPIGDERDDLLPTQVTAQSGTPQTTSNQGLMQDEVSQVQPETQNGQAQVDDSAEDADETISAEMDALKADEREKYKRWASKPRARAFEFKHLDKNEQRALIGAHASDTGASPFIRELKADPRASSEARLAESIASILKRQAAEAESAIRENRNPNLSALDSELRRIVEKELADTLTEELTRQAEQIGVEYDTAAINDAAHKWAQAYSYDLVQGIADNSRNVIQNAMTAYTGGQGLSIGDLKEMLRAAFDPIRADRIAITETTRAYSQAQTIYQGLLKDEGLNFVRVWNSDNDSIVCPICKGLNGARENEQGKFVHPDTKREYDAPPAHTNCRCMTGLRYKRNGNATS